MGHHQSIITFYHLPDLLLPMQTALENALHQLAADYGKRVGLLDYNFVPREKIIEINQNHLQHNYPTDIITFDYCEGKTLRAELFLCPDVILENAQDLNTEFEDELLRVIFHGALHLIGFNDKTEAEQIEMRQAENECLLLMKERNGKV